MGGTNAEKDMCKMGVDATGFAFQTCTHPKTPEKEKRKVHRIVLTKNNPVPSFFDQKQSGRLFITSFPVQSEVAATLSTCRHTLSVKSLLVFLHCGLRKKKIFVSALPPPTPLVRLRFAVLRLRRSLGYNLDTAGWST